jgi:hypothetical protein
MVTGGGSGPEGRSSGVLYGLSESGDLVHSEPVADSDLDTLRALAHERLGRFAAVEIWIESIRVIRTKRDKA